MPKPEVTFVNRISVSGFLNGVVNISFATAVFTANGENVETNDEVTVDLRMDLYCAQQVRDALDRIIEQQTMPAPRTN